MNQIKTILLLSGLTGLMLAIGGYLGGNNGIVIALALASVMNFISYWFSDRIVLAMYRAKETTITDAPELHALVSELARSAGIQKPRIYIIDLPVPNAFATGRNEAHSAVAVSRSLMQLLTPAELRGVLAHELGHIKNRDILISSIAATLAGAISTLAQMAYYAGMFMGGRDDERRNPLGLIALVIVTPIMASLLHLAISRSRELLADETGACVSGTPHELANALRKLHGYSTEHALPAEPKNQATAHLFIVNPFRPSLLMSLFSTHPPLEERIARLEKM